MALCVILESRGWQGLGPASQSTASPGPAFSEGRPRSGDSHGAGSQEQGWWQGPEGAPRLWGLGHCPGALELGWAFREA